MPDQDIYSLSPDLTYNGQNCTNVFHFVQQGSDGTGDPRQELNDMFSFTYATLYRGLMTVGVNVVQYRVRRVAPTETQTLINAIGAAGTHSGGGMPTHSSVLIRSRGSSMDPRRGTGGIKIVGVPFTVVDSGRITEAYSALCQTFGELGEADIVFGTWTWRQIILSVGDNPGAIVQTSVAPRIVTVRSRQIGVGA